MNSVALRVRREEAERFERLHDRTFAGLDQGRTAGSRAPKRRMGIYAAVLAIMQQKPDLSARQVWEKVPSLDSSQRSQPMNAGGFEVYRAQTSAGERVCQANGPNADAEIPYNTFRGYVTAVKKELR